jgi:hypothetical protein
LDRFVRSFYHKANIQKYYFSNDPEGCKKNVIKRNRPGRVEMELKLIDHYTKKYNPPNGLSVWKE